MSVPAVPPLPTDAPGRGRPHRVTGRRPGLLPTAVLAVAGLAVTALGGCAVAEDVGQRAGDAARAEASRAVSDAVMDQICAAVGDGKVSEADLAVIRGILGTASDSGVSDSVLGPVREIAQDGKRAADAVDQVQRECSGRQ